MPWPAAHWSWWRIIGKAILGPVACDVQKACGALQLCAGQSAGVEATVHAMRVLFEDDEADGVFLIDAENASTDLIEPRSSGIASSFVRLLNTV